MVIVRKGDRVRVTHELGTEIGIAYGDARSWQRVLVEFADGTFSSWPLSVVEIVKEDE